MLLWSLSKINYFNIFHFIRYLHHLTPLQIYSLILKGGSTYMPPALAMAQLGVLGVKKI